jgi:LEA14-like dessication related protein
MPCSHRSIAAVWVALLLTTLGGCNSVQRPTTRFKSMSVGDVTAKGFTMNVDVDVDNPNAVALPLTNAEYGLRLAGTRVVESAKIRPAASSIPANGRGTVTIPVPVTFENLLAVGDSIRKGGGDVTYGLDAGLNFDTGVPVVGVQRVPFSYEGTLSVKELLRKNWSTILNSPAAKELAQQVLGGMFNF